MHNRIVVYSSKLHRGGAEKHLVLLLNQLVIFGWEVHLVITQPSGSYEKLLDRKINVYSSFRSLHSYTIALIAGAFSLARVIQKVRPSVVYSIQDGPNLINLLVSRRFRIPAIIEVQNNPKRELSKNRLLRVYFRLCRTLYPHSRMLIALSSGVLSAYVDAIPRLQRSRCRVIHNIGFVNEKAAASREHGQRIWNLVAVGRLTEQKDYRTLLKAVHLTKEALIINGSKNSFRLSILGDGELFHELESLVSEYGIKEEVVFHGFVESIDAYYQAADIFIMSSRWEGFGNVLIEAMAHGVPVISTDCEYGPSEIISNPGVNGILVPVGNAQAIANAVIKLMTDPALYLTLSREGHQRALKFGAREIGKLYHECFQAVANE